MMDHDQIAASLRLALDRQAARHEISPDAWSQIERRLGRRARRQRKIAAVCVAIVAAAAGVTAHLWHKPSSLVSHPHPRPAAQLVIVARAHLNGIVDLTTGYGGVWVIGQGVIYRVDPATAATVATIPTPGTADLSNIATGAGAVWVTSAARREGVYRIDPLRNRVTSFIPLPPTPTGITVAHGRVWVVEPTSGPGIVLRIDPRTNRVSGPPIRVAIGPGLIVPGAGRLWVSGDHVSRINPATGAVDKARTGPWGGTGPLGNANVSVVDAVGAGSVWTTGGNVVRRLDPGSGHVTAAIRVPNAWSVIFRHGMAWVLTAVPPDGLGTVAGIDPASNRVVVRAAGFRGAPAAIAAGPTGLWVIDFARGVLFRLVLASAVR